MSEENDTHCSTCYCKKKEFLLRSMETDQELIKTIEKALWTIEANNVVRISGLEWQIDQEKEKTENES